MSLSRCLLLLLVLGLVGCPSAVIDDDDTTAAPDDDDATDPPDDDDAVDDDDATPDDDDSSDDDDSAEPTCAPDLGVTLASAVAFGATDDPAVASDVIDAYDCAPGLDESGSEVLVLFEPEVDGEYVVALEPFEEDLDLFVLQWDPDADCEGLTCLAYDANEDARDVTTGRSLTFEGEASEAYLLVVEAPQGPSSFALSVGLVGSCTDDRFEPNGDLLLATPMTEGSYAGLRVCELGDAAIDWYRIDPEPDATVHVDVAHAAIEGEVQLALFDAVGTLLVEDAAAGQDNRHVDHTPLGTAPLYARVQMPAGGESGLLPGNAYAMNVRQEARTTCPADDWVGSSPAAPTPLTLPATPAGAACPGDDDALGVDLVAGEPLRALLLGDAGEGELAVELLDPTGASVASTSGGGAVVLEHTATVDGTFALRVTAASDAGAPGVQWAGRVEAGPEAACADDGAEPNDSLAEAAALTPGAHRLCPSGGIDEDWFAVPHDGGTVRFDLGFPPGELALQLDVHDAGGALLASATGSGGALSVEVAGAGGGPLHARVWADTSVDPGETPGAAYVLAARATPWAACPDDGFEAAEAAGTPPALTSVFAAPRTACGGDTDALGIDGEATVLLAFDPLEGTVDATGGSETDRANKPGVAVVSWAAGTFDATIAPDAADPGLPGVAYALTAFDDATGSCTDDALGEPNGRLQQAAPIGLGGYAGLRLCPAAISDTDFYAVPGRAGEQLRVSVANPGGEGDLTLQLLDADGTLLASDGFGGGSGRTLSYDVLESRDLLIRVHQPAALDAGVVAGTRYSLYVASSAVGCAPDGEEAAGDDSAADGVVPPTTEFFRHLTACDVDPDFTRVDLQPGQRLIANVAFAAGSESVDLAMDDGTTSTSAGSSPFGAETLVWTAGSDAVTVDLEAALDGSDGLVYASNVLLSQLSACASDALEPNPPGNPTPGPGSWVDLTACPGDVDAFSLSLLAGDAVTALPTAAAGEGTVQMALIDPDGQVAATYAGSVDADLTFTATLSGDHLLLLDIEADQGPGGVPYALDLQVTAPPCTDDGDEDDDSDAQAVARADGDAPALRSCPGDEDWATADLAAWNALTVAQAFDRAEGEVDLDVVDASGAPLASSAITAAGRRVDWAPGVAGAAHVRASLAADAGAVGVDYDQAWTIGCRPDSAEGATGNDTAATGTPWPGAPWLDLTACPGDDDWFVAELATWNLAEVVLTSDSSEGDLDLAAFPSPSAPTPLATSAGAADVEAMTFTPLLSGNQYLRASLTADAGAFPGNGYGLALSVTCPDAAEPNDSQGSPAVLADGATTNLAICGDGDWYAFERAGWEDQVLVLSSNPTEGDLDVALYDAAGTPLQASSGAAASESVDLAGLPAGTYLAQVVETTDAGLPGSTYGLDLQRTCPADADEDDDFLGAATARPTPATASLTLCPTDSDWHSFSVDPSFGLDVTIAVPTGEGAVVADLLDATGVSLGATVGTASANGVDTTTLSWLNGTGAPATVLLSIALGPDAGAPGLPYDLAATTGPVCTADAYEPGNDDVATAPALADGAYPGLTVCDADEDWFAVSVPVGSAVVVDWTADPSAGLSTAFDLVDAAGTPLLTGLTTATVGPDLVQSRTLINPTDAPLDAWIRVLDAGPVGAVGVDYALTVTTTTGCVDDASEDDDGPAIAPAMVDGDVLAGLSLCVGDPDWFEVLVPAGETVAVTVSHLPTNTTTTEILADTLDPLPVQASTTIGALTTTVTQWTNGSAGDVLVYVKHEHAGGADLIGYTRQLSVGAATCLPDAMEPDDDLASAHFGALGTLAPLSSCGDADWYGFDLAPGEQIVATWTWNEPAAPAFAAEPFDVGGAPLPWSVAPAFVTNAGGTEGVGTLENTTPTLQTVYLRFFDPGFVEPGTGYSLSLASSTGCIPDGFEPNDDAATAATIPDGVPTALRACPADGSDWFAVDLAAWNDVSVLASFTHADGDIDLFLDDPTGATVADAVSPTDDEILNHTAAMAGVHHVRAELVGETDPIPGNDYDLTISVGCAGDSLEPNAWGSPTPIGPGTTANLTICPGEEDAYAFSLPAGVELTAEALFDGSEGSPTLELHDSAGLVASSAPSPSGALLAYDPFAVAPETYELRVALPADAGNHPGTPYAVELTFACDDDGFEDNDDFATAGNASNTNNIVACAGDPDVFALAMRWWNSADFDIGFLNASGDLTMELYDPSQQLHDTAATTNDGESLSLVSPVVDGTWWVMVSGPVTDDAWPGNAYNLTVDRTCALDSLEPNNSLSQTYPMPSSPTLATLCALDPYDYYDIDIASWNTMAVTALFEHAEGDVQLNLYEPNGTLLTTVDTPTDDEQLFWNANGDQSLRVGVTSTADSGVPGIGYDIHASVECQPDALEPNDVALPVLLPEGSYTALNVCPTEQDAFFLETTVGTPIDVTVAPTGGEVELLVELLDPIGAVVASATGPGPHVLSWDPLLEGDHTVEVSVSADTGGYIGGLYDLSWVQNCSDDAFEPNESFAGATAVVPGGYGGLAMCPGSDDWYSLSVEAWQALEVVASFDSFEGDLLVELYDPAPALVASSPTEPDQAAATHPVTSAGVHGIRISPTTDPGVPGVDYGLAITRLCDPDPGEPANDAAVFADPLPAGPELLSLCTGDQDWFVVDVADWNHLGVTVAHPVAEGDLDLTVLDAAFTPYASSATPTDDEDVSIIRPPTGTYYVGATLGADPGDAGVGYTLSSVVDCDADTLEPNDFAAPAPLPYGLTADMNVCPGDEDGFEFTVAGDVQIDLTYDDAEGAPSVVLYDPSDQPVGVWSVTPGLASLVLTAPVPGTYRLEVDLPADTGAYVGNGYTVELQGLCTDDGFEPNDAIGAPTVVAMGNYPGLTACADDDWYAFDLRDWETVTVEALHTFADGDLNIDLHDPSDAFVTSAITLADDETLTHDPGVDGQWHARVYLASDDSVPGNDYDLDVSTICRPDTNEPDDTQATAGFAPEIPETLHACDSDQVDWFSVPMGAWNRMTGSVSYEFTEGDVDVWLYDGGGNPTTSWTGPGPTHTFNHDVFTSDDYALKVDLSTDLGAAPGTRYDIDVQVVCRDDAHEPDDWSNPVPNAIGTYLDRNTCMGDQDAFDIDLVAGQPLTVTQTWDGTEGFYLLTLVGPGDSIVPFNVSPEPSGQVLTATAPGTGTFRLEVQFLDNGLYPGAAYDLTIAPGCVDDAFEDNDDVAQAAAGPLSATTVAACPFDADYWSFPVESWVELTVDAQFTHADGDLDLVLYDPAVQAVDSSQTTTDDESVQVHYGSAATLVAEVLLGTDDALPGNDYSLTGTYSCVDDVYEPNDVQGTGPTLTDGTYPLVNCAGEDWFVATVPAGGTIDVTTAVDDLGEGNVDLVLFDTAPTTLDQDFAVAANKAVTWTNPTPSAATVWIQVLFLPFSADGTYPGQGYDLTIATTAGCAPDAYEDNDTFGAAATGPLSSVSGLTRCPGDPDFYSWPMERWSELTVQASFVHAEGDLGMEMYDGIGNPVTFSDTLTGVETVTYSPQVATTLTVDVFLGTDDAVPGVDYALVGTLDCTNDGLEPNDTDLAAALVFDGFSDAFVNACADDDWYEATVAVGETITVTVTSDPTEGDIDLGLFDSVGIPLDSASGADPTHTVSWTNVYTSPEVVRVQSVLVADSGSFPGNGYTLDVSVAGAACADDGFEDNDDALTATPAPTAPTAATSCPTDEDWYGPIPLAPWTTLLADATFPTALGNIDLLVYDSANTLVGFGGSTEDDEVVIYPATATDAHYVVATLTSDDATPGNDYALSTNVVCTFDFAEPNDATAATYPLDLGTTTGLAACGDDDWFEFPSQPWAEMTVTVDFDDSEGQLDLFLYDDANNLLGSSTNTSGPQSLTFTPVGTTTKMRVSTQVDAGSLPGNGYDVTIGATCPTDGWEPNDTSSTPAFASAFLAEPLTLCATDEDWFTVFAFNGETITATAEHAVGEGNIDLELYDSSGTILLASASTDDPSEVLSYLTLSGPTFLLRVVYDAAGDVGSFPGNGYNLSIDVSLGGPCADDVYEDNDSSFDATTLLPGSYTGLRTCDFDDDWYAVSLLTGETLTANAYFGVAEGNLDLEIYRPEVTLMAAGIGFGDDETVSATATTDDVYYVRAYLAFDDGVVAGNDYDLELIVGASSVCIDDSLYEDNDTYSGLFFVSSPPLVDPLVVSCDGDEDWFGVSVAGGDDLRAQIDFAHADADLDLFFTDRLEVIQASSESSSDTELIEHPIPPAGAGVWGIQVFQFNDTDGDPSTGSYSLDIQRCDGDAFEHNDSSSETAIVSAGTFTNLNVCTWDEDWYEIFPTAGDTITVDALFSHSSGDVDVLLWDDAFSQVDSSQSSTDNEQVSYVAATNNPVYVQVLLFDDPDGITGAPYDMTVTLTNSNSSCADDGFEPNNTLNDAIPLGQGLYPSLRACLTDPDVFNGFLNLAGGTYSVTVSWPAGDGQLQVNLYDANLIQIDTATNTGGSVTVTGTGGSFEPFYVEVEVLTDNSAGGTGIVYTLDLTHPSISAG